MESRKVTLDLIHLATPCHFLVTRCYWNQAISPVHHIVHPSSEAAMHPTFPTVSLHISQTTCKLHKFKVKSYTKKHQENGNTCDQQKEKKRSCDTRASVSTPVVASNTHSVHIPKIACKLAMPCQHNICYTVCNRNHVHLI